MAVEKYTPLAQITLTSSASSVTFGSIPSGYRDLRLVVSGTSSANTNTWVRCNGDTGTNYYLVQMEGDGTSTYSGAGSYSQGLRGGNMTSTLNNWILEIMDYSATDKHKTALNRSNNTGGNVIARAERWANTSAITSLEARATESTFAAGTTLRLWGVK